MPRKGPAPKRPLVVDPVYSSPLVTQLVNKILLDGKKSIAETHRLRRPRGLPREDRHRPGRHAQARAGQRQADARGQEPPRRRRDLPGAGRGQARPRRPRSRCAGSSATRAQRREKTMTERLMNEILDASNGLGAAVKRREDTHKMAESNKAFAHYRW